ncbi:MAG TPA: hypothetical protein VGK73_17545, partial [Polyangiaceae bacterium]
TGASPRSAESRRSRAPAAPPSDDEGAALLAAVEAVPATLRALFEHQESLGPAALSEVERTLENVEQRLARRELRVVVAGERRSGKSTLLDAIVGDRLLGGARGGLAVVTFLRRRDVPSYRARFESGKEDDFSSRVPDRAGELDLVAAKLDARLAILQRDCHRARLELGQAEESRGQAELRVDRALGDVEQARELAEDAESELAAAEEDAARVERTLGALEAGIPAQVRARPPRFALFLWLWFALFVLVRRERWLRYRTSLSERESARARLLLEREKATAAAETRALAEARFQPLDRGAERARSHSSELERGLRDADAERERLRSEREELRSEREHLVSERWRRFFADLTALAKKPGLVELAIDYPAKLLPEDVTLIDLPGLSNETSPEWALIREQADGCILVSELDRAVSEAAKLFLRRLREVVPHVLLVLTKMDQAHERALQRSEGDPWGEVENARRIGTRRFARELGRAPDRVLSVSVAAEALLSDRGSELAVRSEHELDKLFLLLRRERALILGARAASAIRRCIAGLAEAETEAERAYRERILELERQRTPEPAVFREQALAQAAPAIGAAASRALSAAGEALGDGFRVLERLPEQSIDLRTRKKQYAERAAELARELALGAVHVRTDAQVALEAGIERGVASIERGLFEALRERYQLLHEVRRTTSSSPRLDKPAIEAPNFAAVVEEVREDVARFDKMRWLLGASGGLAGAAGLALLDPWFSLGGAALGGLLALVKRESRLQKGTHDRFRAALYARQREYAAELAALEPAVAVAIELALERSLERAMIRFARFIEEPLEAEREALEAEHRKLAELEELRGRVSEHDRELERLLEAGRRASVGLCRAS